MTTTKMLRLKTGANKIMKKDSLGRSRSHAVRAEPKACKKQLATTLVPLAESRDEHSMEVQHDITICQLTSQFRCEAQGLSVAG